MTFNRRDFISTSLSAGFVGFLAACRSEGRPVVDEFDLTQAANAPILKLGNLTQPVIIESIELLRSGNLHLVRTRSKDGAVGISVTNERIVYLAPLLQQRVIPFFIGKDARSLEALLDGVYVHDSNYKMQGLALWCCVAWVEFSILDLLGKISRQHVSELFGGKVREEIPIYVASSNRNTTPAEEVEILKKRIAETGAKAVKFKVGGGLSCNKDSLPNRSEELQESSEYRFRWMISNNVLQIVQPDLQRWPTSVVSRRTSASSRN